jgi:cation transport regulator ChaB
MSTLPTGNQGHPTESRPVPDPTVATNEAVERAVHAERDYVDGQVGIIVERLNGIDRATVVLNETVNRVPTALSEGLGHLQAVMDERFRSIELQFRERDTRSERESRDNKVAVDAAFAAQKEAAAKQDEGNAKAIDKSERATTETIKTNYDLSAAKIEALTKSLDEVKLSVNTILSTQRGGRETISSIYAFAGFLLVLLVIAGIYLGTRSHTTTPIVTTPTVTVTVPAP